MSGLKTPCQDSMKESPPQCRWRPASSLLLYFWQRPRLEWGLWYFWKCPLTPGRLFTALYAPEGWRLIRNVRPGSRGRDLRAGIVRQSAAHPVLLIAVAAHPGCSRVLPGSLFTIVRLVRGEGAFFGDAGAKQWAGALVEFCSRRGFFGVF